MHRSTYYLKDWTGESFRSTVELLGYIPPGSNYTLTIALVDTTYESIESVQANNEYIDIVTESMEIELGDEFSSEDPDDGHVFSGAGNFDFKWYTPGFRSGIKIKFRFISFNKWHSKIK